jgi:hypothetical protein
MPASISRTISPRVVVPTTQVTAPIAPVVSKAPAAARASAQAGSIDSFRDMAKEITASRAAAVASAKTSLKSLPAGIVSADADVAKLKQAYETLSRSAPVLPGRQTTGDRVLKLTNTDFAQTEVPGLKPSGAVFQVLQGGDTRANFSQFQTPAGGNPITAVELGKVQGSKVTISGLYGFANAGQLSASEYLDATKALKKVQSELTKSDAASGRAVSGARNPNDLNATISALIQPSSTVLTDAEKKVMSKLGRAVDLNTVTGPVGKEGYQTVGFDEGSKPGSVVAFQSGTAKDLYGAPYQTAGLKPGQPGYKYTFVAEVQDTSK